VAAQLPEAEVHHHDDQQNGEEMEADHLG
jgi:hypothetical protein